MEPCLLFVSFCLPISEWLCHWFVQCWRLKLCQCVLAYEEHMRKLATRGGTLLITVTEKDKGGCFFRVFARSKTDTVTSDFWHSLMYQKKKKRMFFFLFSFGDSRGWHHFVIKVSARLSPFYRTSYQIPLFYFLRQFTWLSSGLFVSLLSVYSSSSFIQSLLPSHLSFLFISSFSSFLLLSFAFFQCFAINEIQLYEFKDFLCLIHW